MLTSAPLFSRLADGKKIPGKQRGVVLIIALIVLVAMSLAAIALVRSVDTANIITGNLAFKQAATHSGDIGTESATAWLEMNNNASLDNDMTANGYFACAAPVVDTCLIQTYPAAGQSWDAFWTATLAANAVALAADAAGNTASYVIHRLCNQVGSRKPALNPGVSCAVSPVVVAGECYTPGCRPIPPPPQLYYRITVRIAGPRNTVSYVQSIVTL